MMMIMEVFRNGFVVYKNRAKEYIYVPRPGENVNLAERINHGFNLSRAEWGMQLLLILDPRSLKRMVKRWFFLKRQRISFEDTWYTIEKQMGRHTAEAERQEAEKMKASISGR